jgi:hypothetical protein
MMKPYINMPLKKALPLFFIGALLLAGTTGCLDYVETSAGPAKQITETGLYQGHEVHMTTITFKDGRRIKSVRVEGLGRNESSCEKWFDKNELLWRELLSYSDGHGGRGEHNPPIKDPTPGQLAGEVLVDYANAHTAAFPLPDSRERCQPNNRQRCQPNSRERCHGQWRLH